MVEKGHQNQKRMAYFGLRPLSCLILYCSLVIIDLENRCETLSACAIKARDYLLLYQISGPLIINQTARLGPKPLKRVKHRVEK